jgi:uncharacterized membrane protein YhaH (DUF805 family)
MTQNVYESPSADLETENTEIVKLTSKQVFFSFKGRIGRQTYWMHYLALIGIFLVVGILTGLASSASPGSIAASAMVILMGLFYILAIWVSIALSVKRWHDRNKSGWWVLIGFVPIIGGFWVLIENGFLVGDEAANNYGPATF